MRRPPQRAGLALERGNDGCHRIGIAAAGHPPQDPERGKVLLPEGVDGVDRRQSRNRLEGRRHEGVGVLEALVTAAFGPKNELRLLRFS